mgnify:FL=1
MAKRVRFKPGDVYQIELVPGYVGYGRVIVAKKGYNALHELYKLDPSKSYTLEQLRGMESLTFLWGSSAMISSGDWPIVGHIPVPPEYSKIRFYQAEDYSGSVYIYNIDEEWTVIYKSEFKKLKKNEKFYEYGNNGYEAIRIYYIHLLKQCGLMPENIQARDETPEFIPVDIFDFDLAADVRDDFEARLKRGKTVEEATKLVLRKYRSVLEDEDDMTTVYLALAALQLERGGIRSEIKPQVEAAITHDLARWESEASPEIFEARKAVLQRLQEGLK